MAIAGRASLRRKSRIKIADEWLRQILSLLYRRRYLSRSEIIEATGLNAASVSHALRYLLRRGVLHKAGECEGDAGRRREVFTLNSEAGYFVALDLEGDRLRFALTNFVGDVRCRWEESLQFREPLKPEKVVEGIARVTRDLDQSQLSRVLAVGVSYPGLLDAEGRLSAVNLPENLFWIDQLAVRCLAIGFNLRLRRAPVLKGNHIAQFDDGKRRQQ